LGGGVLCAPPWALSWAVMSTQILFLNLLFIPFLNLEFTTLNFFSTNSVNNTCSASLKLADLLVSMAAD
jgi:hypothetical protein